MFYTHSRRTAGVTRHEDAKQIEPDKQLPTAVPLPVGLTSEVDVIGTYIPTSATVRR